LKNSKRLQSLKSIVEALKEDGILSEPDTVRASGSSVKVHPIQAISSLSLVDQRTQGKILTDEVPSVWYAAIPVTWGERVFMNFSSLAPEFARK